MKKVLVNFLYQASFQLLTIILPMITIPIVSRALGAEGIGFFGFTTSIVNYFLLLAGLGMASYSIREIAYVKSDTNQLSKKFWELQLFNMFFSITIFFIYSLFFLITAKHYLYLIQSLMILAVFFDISWLFQGIENFKEIAIRRAIVKILALILIIIFVRDQNDLWVYALIISCSQLTSSVILWHPALKLIEFKKVTFKEIFSHLHPALNFFILQVSATIFVNINKTILGMTSTMVMVGYFTNSLQLIVVLGAVIGALNKVMLPRMSSMQKEEGEKLFIDTLQRTIHIQLFFTISLMFGIIAINEKFIEWFFGSDFYFIKNLIPILAPVIVFQQLHQAVANQFLVPKNELRFYNLTMIIGTLLNTIICIVLIPFVHVYGAVFGFLSGQIFLAISRVGMMLKKSIFKFELIKILKWSFSGCLMLLTVWLLTNRMAATMMTTIIQGIIGGAIYMLLTFLLKANPLDQLLKK